MAPEIEQAAAVQPPRTDSPAHAAGPNNEALEIGVLPAPETAAAVGVVARGMRDNPLHIAAFGPDPHVRLRKYHLLMASAFAVKDFSHTLVARRPDGTVVGVCGMMPPGNCVPRLGEKLRLLPRLLPLGPRSLARVLAWLGAWAKRDPAERHWHRGPLAVDLHLQGQGIGSKLLRVFCAQMDAAGEAAYLETDKPINVRLYERFGFSVVGKHDVIGVPNWFMLRKAHEKRR